MSDTSTCQVRWGKHLATRRELPLWDVSRESAVKHWREKLFLPHWRPGMPFSRSMSADLFISTQQLWSPAVHPDSPQSWAGWKDWQGFHKHDQSSACHRQQMEHKANCFTSGRTASAAFFTSRVECASCALKLSEITSSYMLGGWWRFWKVFFNVTLIIYE